MSWQTGRVGDECVLAPDGSEIRPLIEVSRGSMVHCTLEPGKVTRAVQHRTVEEVWFCLSGAGQLWRRWSGHAEIVDVRPGTAVSIPQGVAFQFRAAGADALQLVLTTMPPWPGADEAFVVEGAWEPDL